MEMNKKVSKEYVTCKFSTRVELTSTYGQNSLCGYMLKRVENFNSVIIRHVFTM